MWIVCITSVRHVLTVNGYGGRQTKENEKSWCFKGWETLGGKAKDDNFDLKLFKSDEGDWKRFDLGIQYGIGLELSDRYLINLTGQNGFISPVDGGDDPKNMTFTIGVGYRF